MRKEKYPTDLTDSQWAIIEPLFSGMRNRKWSKRELVNAVLYLVKTGCQWRQLPHDFPPYSTVHSFYRRANIGAFSGTYERECRKGSQSKLCDNRLAKCEDHLLK